MGKIRRLRVAGMLGAAGLAAAVALAGCGGAEDAGSGSAPEAGVDKPAPPGAAEGKPKDAPRPDLRVEQRSIIYTGSITVRVQHVDRAAARAASIATGVGGFVGGDERTSDDTHSEASLELRVPADKFSAVVDQIAGLGDQERRDINTEDVTEEALDLDARIVTQRARVESGRRLLAQAKTLDELIMLEGELAKREADLASLEAKKRRLDDLTALSTITVVLLGPDAQPPTGFLVGLNAGWTAFVASMELLLTVLGALLPWLVALGVPVIGVIWLVRRIGRGKPPVTPVGLPRQPAPPPTAAGAPAPPTPRAFPAEPAAPAPPPTGKDAD